MHAFASSARPLAGGEREVALPLTAGDETGEEIEDEELTSAERELFDRLERIENRLESLESDPIERGYRYIASTNEELRRQGILALERVAENDPRAREQIRRLLTDADRRVRLTALDTLADINDREAAPLVAPLLDDASADVRAEAINTLARLGAEESGMMIAGLLADESNQVREHAADALGRLKTKEGGSLLVGALSDPDNEVRGEAIASLGEIGATETVPALLRMYNEEPGPHRTRLMLALNSLGHSEPYDAEIDQQRISALEHENPNTRRNALRTLSWLARERARDVFEKAAEDPDPRVREEARRALGRLRGGRRR